MSGYVWDLSGTDKHCASYGPGHLIHWIHFNHSIREPSVVIPVTAVVDEKAHEAYNVISFMPSQVRMWSQWRR
jgi:hypothetical protein